MILKITIIKKLLTRTGKRTLFAVGMLSYGGHIAVLIRGIHIKESSLLFIMGVEAFVWFTLMLYFLLFDDSKPYSPDQI